jgi:UDP-N-acetylbacillosamine N-acetyltransferase
MKLLILGAGSHGKDVAEIAEDIGYDEVAYLDDRNPEAVGRLNEFYKFKGQYENAFVAIGNNRLRSELIGKLKNCGYTIPTIVHPSAYVSRSATIGSGTVIEPRVVLNARCHIGEGCIVSSGAIVDHDAQIGDYCNVKTGALVKAGWKIEGSRKLGSDENVQIFEAQAVNSSKSGEAFAKEYKKITGREASFF